jgi:transposase-like protein
MESRMKDKGGCPTLYNPRVHLKLLESIYSQGEGIIQFCADAGICQKTFYNWRKKHKKFRALHKKCLPMGAAASERNALAQGKDINYQLWYFIHHSRFRDLYKKLPKLRDRTLEGKLKSAWKGLERGSLSPQEFTQVTTGIMSQLKIKELELKNRELELKAEELKLQKKRDSVDLSDVSDEVLKVFMAVKEGKKVRIVEE